MDLFARLRLATLQAQEENELPDCFARRILSIAEHPQRYRNSRDLLLLLLEQLPDYDTYAQTGYLGMGVDDTILRATLEKLEGSQRKPPAP